ncbi:MAG TPA: O-antigen polymerase [bacterium]|nr:O-antigen polymerase [bacterium]HPS28788.1 O-antigen polymerase [bacterium]
MYYLISFVILIISYYLFKKCSGTMAFNRLNMISYIFYLQLFLFSFIGSVLVVNKVDNHYMINRLAFESSRFYGWVSIMYVMIAMPIGMLLANYFLKNFNTRILFSRYAGKLIEPVVSMKDSYMRFPLLVLSAISIFACVYTFYVIKTIPILYVFKGSGPEILARMRIEASREFGGNIIFRNLFAIMLTPVLSYISYAYYKMSKSKKDFVWFELMFFSSIMILTYNIAKSPLVTYLIGFLLLHILIEGSVSKKLFIFAGFISFVILAYLYLSTMGLGISDFASLVTSVNQGIPGRILLSQSAGTFFSFDIFPDRHNFLGITSLSNILSGIFSIEKSDRSARIIMSIVMPSAIEEGTGGVMNTLFIGESWANFGLIGVVFAPIWVGFVIQWSYVTILKSKKTPLMLALMVYLTISWPVTGGFNDFIYNMSILTMLAMFMLIIGSAVLLRIFKTGKKHVMFLQGNRQKRND